MELLQLEYFIRVARLEHISRAAEELHISQPALSLTIRRLETELGVPLFERSGRNIRLTQYGQLFYEKTEPLWNGLQEAMGDVRHLKHANENKLVIFSPPLYAFPGLLPRINSSFPDIAISNIDTNMDDALLKLRNKNADFCIISRGEDSRPDPDFEEVLLRREKIVVVLPTNHRFSRRKSVRLDELAAEPLAAYPSGVGFRPLMDDELSRLGCSANIVFEASTAYEMIEAVRSQFCIALLQESVVKNYSPIGITYTPIGDPPFRSALKMLWPKGVRSRPTVRMVQQIIRAYFEEFPGEPESEDPSSPPSSS